MIDCPAILHSGGDLIISLSAYILPPAFKPFTTKMGDIRNIIFDENRETHDEQALRERKRSLLHLFDAVGLRPVVDSSCSNRRAGQVKNERVNRVHRERKVRIEVVGDGEEIEVEDAEELSENELDVIYQRWDQQFFYHILSQSAHCKEQSTVKRPHNGGNGTRR
jgi:DNA repair protein RAD5